MTSVSSERTYQFKAVTDLWTGAVTLEGKDGQIKEKIVSDRLINTGLLGSIRWWFEVLVRGLGGSVCDPSNTNCQDRNHCVVCELFGCTGWARKFTFAVLDGDGDIKRDQIRRNTTFSLRFTPLRPIRVEEWAILDATLRLIAQYGAIGGKTVLKPTDEPSRAGEIHHQDYGIVEIVNVNPPIAIPKVAEVKNYISEERWRKPKTNANDSDFSWASLKYFWFVDQKTLTREAANGSSFNKVLGRKESKACRDCGQVHNPPTKCPNTKRHPKRESEQLINPNDEVSKWLAGSKQGSKKVFSFKNPARTFGFVKPGLLNFCDMKTRLRKAWLGLQDDHFLEGAVILDRLLPKEDRS